MNNIIAINSNGIFTNGKSTTTYYGHEITGLSTIQKTFTLIQKRYPKIKELHISTSPTNGKYAQSGNPLLKFGTNAWCRAAYTDGTYGPWIFLINYNLPSECASNCVEHCIHSIYDISMVRFRSAILNIPVEKLSLSNIGFVHDLINNIFKQDKER